MTAEEYCAIIRRLGWSWRTAAEELGISYRLNAYYKSGEVAIALPVAKLLRLIDYMAENGVYHAAS